MSNVIKVDFKNKMRIDDNSFDFDLASFQAQKETFVKPEVDGKRWIGRRQNKGEVFALTRDMHEIQAELDFCEPGRDDMRIARLEAEMQLILAKLDSYTA